MESEDTEALGMIDAADNNRPNNSQIYKAPGTATVLFLLVQMAEIFLVFFV